MAKKRGYIAKEKVTCKDSVKIALAAIPSLSLVIIVIGGILAGVFTATEASAIAVVYSLILSLCYRTLSLKMLPANFFTQTAKMSAIVIFMLATSSVMSWGNGIYPDPEYDCFWVIVYH